MYVLVTFELLDRFKYLLKTEQSRDPVYFDYTKKYNKLIDLLWYMWDDMSIMVFPKTSLPVMLELWETAKFVCEKKGCDVSSLGSIWKLNQE